LLLRDLTLKPPFDRQRAKKIDNPKAVCAGTLNKVCRRTKKASVKKGRGRTRPFTNHIDTNEIKPSGV